AVAADRLACHAGRVLADGTGLATGVLVRRATDGGTDEGGIDALNLLADARRARWATPRAGGCRDHTGRQLADGKRTGRDHPGGKIHGSENRIAALHAVSIETLVPGVGHADLVNHTGVVIDGNALHKRPIGHAVARRPAATVIFCHGLGDAHGTWECAVIAAAVVIVVVTVVALFAGVHDAVTAEAAVGAASAPRR